MLTKLIKHEFKSTARFFVPSFGAILVLAVINRLFVFRSGVPEVLGFFQGLMLVAYFALIAITSVMTIVVSLRRYSKNMYGDEGYLMHTLPVTSSGLLFSKAVAAVSWALLSLVVAGASMIILVFNSEIIVDMLSFLEVVRTEVMYSLGLSFGLVTTGAILLCLAGIILNIFMAYAAISIANLVQKYRLFVGLAAWIGISTTIQFIMSKLSDLFVWANVFGVNELSKLGVDSPTKLFEMGSTDLAAIPTAVYGVMGSCIALLLALALATFYATNYLMANKLNID